MLSGDKCVFKWNLNKWNFYDKKTTVKAVIMFFIAHLSPLPCRSYTEGK